MGKALVGEEDNGLQEKTEAEEEDENNKGANREAYSDKENKGEVDEIDDDLDDTTLLKNIRTPWVKVHLLTR